MQIRIRAKSLKLSVLYRAASRHHVINVVRGDCPRRLFWFFFLSGVLQILVHACGQGHHIQLRCSCLVVPREHSIKCNGFWQLRVHILILCQILFLVVSQQDGLSVGRGLKSDSSTSKVLLLLSGMLNVEYNLILNPLQNDHIPASIKYQDIVL